MGKLMSLGGRLAALAVILGLAGTGLAADEPPVVTARVLHSQSAYLPGGTYPLAVELTIAPGYHINSDRPSEPDLFPSKLTLAGDQQCSWGPAAFPPARPYQPPWQGKPLLVLDGRVLVRVNLTVAGQAKPGQYRLSGRLSYQACDDTACLLPEDLDLGLTVTVAPAGAKPDRLHPEVFTR